MRKPTQKDWLNYKRAKSLAYLSQSELSAERMKKITNHSETQKIRYTTNSNYKEAYDYVDSLFPNADVKNVTIYRVAKSCLSKLGLKNIGGCYDKLSRIVVISKELDFVSSKKDKTWSTITAKITTDEVIVHELLHYVSMYNSGSCGSMQMEEEFAYGNSLGYLRAKGHSDDRIIVYNFLPYFINVAYSKNVVRKVFVENGYDTDDVMAKPEPIRKKIFKKLDKNLFEETKRIAIENARELIRIYSKDESCEVEVKVKDNSGSTFGMMDFGF